MTYLPNELSVNLYALCMLLFIYISLRAVMGTRCRRSGASIAIW